MDLLLKLLIMIFPSVSLILPATKHRPYGEQFLYLELYTRRARLDSIDTTFFKHVQQH